ncbi:acyl dehydratase [Mycobacterium sp. OTB74]|nr:acyl dehydratase [Mycobacterium sp. OTB74]
MNIGIACEYIVALRNTPGIVPEYKFDAMLVFVSTLSMPLDGQQAAMGIRGRLSAGRWPPLFAATASQPRCCSASQRLSGHQSAPLRGRSGMTTVLEEPADLLKFVGQVVGTTSWMTVTQRQVDLFAEATGDRQWIHTDPKRAATGPFRGRIAHCYLALSLAPVVISEVVQIRELTTTLNYGLNRVRFPAPIPVGAQIRAEVRVLSVQQKISGVEAMFALTFEIDGDSRPACVADVIMLYP